MVLIYLYFTIRQAQEVIRQFPSSEVIFTKRETIIHRYNMHPFYKNETIVLQMSPYQRHGDTNVNPPLESTIIPTQEEPENEQQQQHAPQQEEPPIEKQQNQQFEIHIKKTQNDSNKEEIQHHDHGGEERSAPSCFEPMAPVIGTPDFSRILNMGFPKCGSSSLQALFQKSGFNSMHYRCKGEACGLCMQRRAKAKQNLLEGCGNATAFTQMDFTIRFNCIFPQIVYLEELYRAAPHATWLLPFRNVSSWIRSMNNWGGATYLMTERLDTRCDFPQLGFTKAQTNKTDADFIRLYCKHVQHVRGFVKSHPSLSLIEFSIESNSVGDLLSKHIPGVKASSWGQANSKMSKGPRTKRWQHPKKKIEEFFLMPEATCWPWEGPLFRPCGNTRKRDVRI